jgi:hypothetical protein
MTTEDDGKLRFRDSKELFEMYRSFEALPPVLMRYVQEAQSYDDMVKRAAEVTKECQALMMRLSGGPCPVGQSWDEATGTCV